MSSHASARTLRLEPVPSARLRLLLAVLYVLAVAGLVAVLPAAWWPVLLAIGAALLWWDRRAHRPPGAILCDGQGDWWLDGTGPFVLRPGTVVTPWLVVLVLRGAGRIRRLALLPDSLPAPQWRRLRVYLRTAPLSD